MLAGTSHFECLAIELKWIIFEFVEADDDEGAKTLRSLSCVSKQFRQLLLPIVLRSIVLREDEKSGQSVQAIASSSHASLVRKLHYQGVTSFGAYHSDGVDPETVLHDYSADVLSHLGRFSHLEELVIEFAFDEEEWCEAGMEEFDEDEDIDAVRAAETSAPWRSLMAKSFAAIVANQSHSIKSLELRRVPCRDVSVWSTNPWHDFLRRFEKVHVSIREWDNGSHWCINQLDAYVGFVERLSLSILDYLHSVQEFTLIAPESGMLGLEGFPHLPLMLHDHIMPHLQELTLSNVFVCPELVSFITARSPTLEKLTLDNCFSTTPSSPADNPMTWQQFFVSLAAAGLNRLTELHVTWSAVDSYGQLRWGRPEVEANPDIMVFRYVELSDKYGKAYESEIAINESIRLGQDLRAYKKLQTMVQCNRDRKSRRKQ